MPTHLATENALLNEARNGNPDSFGLLVDHYRQNLYRLTLRITGNPEDAEDALQDAILNAYCNLQRFRGNSRFYTWMSRIALNQALMSLRRRRRTRQVTFSSLETAQTEGTAKLEVEDDGLSPEELFANGELERVLNRALRRLGPRLSSVFILRNVYGFSAMELTRMLGLSAPAVKSRLLRARTRLRKRLSKSWTSSGNVVPRVAAVATTCIESHAQPGQRRPVKRQRVAVAR
jgi:RNA polymerase sigma-70 factor (ECF subfamily)